MSGQQIGTVVGAVIGGYFFGPAGAQIGGAIGGYIGGVIDPTEIFGPRLTDASTQTARDGVPRTYGYGTFPSSGNLIWCSDLRERKNTEGGKGSTTETITYQYFRSYAIAVCEGPADGNGIAGYRIVKRNGKVVYDTRTDAELTSLGYSANEIAETRAAQSKFVQRARFYYGVADQEPDPTIQAVNGADDVPGYSYTAYMVMTDDDVTELRGAVPQYEFVVSVCGDRTDDNLLPTLLVTGSASPTGEMWAKAKATSSPVFELIEGSDYPGMVAPTPAHFAGTFGVAWADGLMESTDGMATWQPQSEAWLTAPVRLVGGPAGWASQPLANGSISAPVIASAGARYYAAAQGSRVLYESTDLETWTPISDGEEYAGQSYLLAIQNWFDVKAYVGGLVACVRSGFSDLGARFKLSISETGRYWDTILVNQLQGEGHYPFQVEVDGLTAVALCTDNGGVWTSANNFASPIATGIVSEPFSSGNPPYNTGRKIVHSNGRFFILGSAADSNKVVSSSDGGLTWDAPVTLPIPSAVGIAAGFVGDGIITPIPDSPGYYIDEATGEIIGPSGTQISTCAPDLAEIVEDQCALRGVTTVDASELEGDDVLGFRIANTSSPQKNILAAQPGYFFDSSEFDGVLHFPKRGGEDSFHIPFDEMVMREGETVQWERTQEAELLRKVTFTYFDPRATYTPTSQTGERRAGTIQAMGETASQLPLVGTGDWAAKAADINLKSAWYEPDECTFPVSLDWAELVPAAVGTIEDERGTIHRVRILDIKDDGLIRLVKGRRTDASAYQSNASGKPIPLPTFPGSDIRGPTTGSVFNIPAVLDSHDRPGIYWAATGSFTSWIGAVLQVQRAGQWVTLAQTVSGATVGSLAEDLPYHGGDIDNVNTLSVRINATLETVTYTQLLNERNPFVIAYPDGTGEIIQFQDAELDSEGIWNCTKLLRGRLNTREGLHLAGATIAALDSLIQFVDLRPDDLGKTLLFRVISSGTDPDSGTPFTVELDRIWSSTEWEVAELEAVKDGDDFTVSWIPRHRLGTDVNPIRSGNWDGFLVRYQYADQFFEEVITETSKTYNLPGASDVEFTVSQLNRLTGAGPGVSVTHE